jgi:2-keto-4-pentenoate hydratase
MLTPESLHAAAGTLLDAARTRTPCPPLRLTHPEATVDDGYAVQQLVHEQSRPTSRRVGRKIGLTSAAVQQQMGVCVPDYGVLFADMCFGDRQPIPADRLLQPRVEAEVAFVLGADLPERPVVIADVLRATDFVVAAIEVVDSRIRDWDISIFDTIADNASSGLFVLGGAPRSLRDIDDLGSRPMSLTCDGAEVSSGSGAACLGHPANAVVWLANTMVEHGSPLRAGEIVLSGSLGRLVPVQHGKAYEATIAGVGSVHAEFE